MSTGADNNNNNAVHDLWPLVVSTVHDNNELMVAEITIAKLKPIYEQWWWQ